MECYICAEQVKEVVACLKCDHKACHACTARFLLDSLTACCMNCREGWSNSHIRRNFPLKWVENEWKARCKKMLFEQEKSWMPDTQTVASRYVAFKKDYDRFWVDMSEDERLLIKRNFDDLSKRLRRSHKEAEEEWEQQQVDGASRNRGRLWDRQRQIDEDFWARDEHKEVGDDFRMLRDSKWTWQSKNRHALQGEDTHSSKTFHKACPKNDCRGFLAEDWKCGMCQCDVCKHCHCVIEGSHVCNPDDVKSAKLIMESTQPCPNCAARVFKTSGCDHMWCTACQTGFDWRTGQPISNARNTNPYFYRWLETAEGRQAGANDIGARAQVARNQQQPNACRMRMTGLVWQAKIREPVNSGWKRYFAQFDDRDPEGATRREAVRAACTLVNYFDQGMSERFGLHSFNNHEYNPQSSLTYRGQYMAGQISEKEFLTACMKTKKRLDYESELAELVTATVGALDDWLWSVFDQPAPFPLPSDGDDSKECETRKAAMLKYLDSYKEIEKFFDENSKQISAYYGYTAWYGLCLVDPPQDRGWNPFTGLNTSPYIVCNNTVKKKEKNDAVPVD